MYGIALIPEKQTMKELVSFRSEFQNILSGPHWGTKENIPHVTLFKTELKSEAKPKNMLHDIYEKADFDIPVSTFQGISLENRNWVFGNIVNNDFLKELHKTSVAECKPFIAKEKIKVKKFMGETIEDVENYLKYGYRYVGSKFTPQFILGRYAKENELPYSMVEKYEQTFLGKEVLFSRIVVYKTGRYNFLGPIVASKKLQTFKERLFIS